MKHSKATISREINGRIFRMKGLAAQLSRDANTNALLPGHVRNDMLELSKKINVITSKSNLRLKRYRQECYKEGKML